MMNLYFKARSIRAVGQPQEATQVARRISQAIAAGAMVGCAMVASCASPGGSRSASNSKGSVNVGLDQYLGDGVNNQTSSDTASAMTPDEMRRWLELDATVLPSLAAGRVPESPTVDAGTTPPQTNLSPSVSIDSATTTDSTPDKSAAPPSIGKKKKSAPTSSHAVGENSIQRQQRLVRELAAILRQRVSDSDTPLREYAALAALELLVPGVTPDPTSIPTLTPREVELLGAWRDLFGRTDEELSSDTGDIGALSAAVAELAVRMGEWETLDLSNAVMCSRVEGYGQFTPMPSTKMLAGRSNPAIVYVEVEHMTHRASSGPDGEPGFLVELTQELSLYHDSDGLLAWRQPEQQVRDFSRQRRRDFFVVQRIDLPSTLSVGAYRLKITMRDKATGAIAELSLPIEFVADAALVRAE